MGASGLKLRILLLLLPGVLLNCGSPSRGIKTKRSIEEALSGLFARESAARPRVLRIPTHTPAQHCNDSGPHHAGRLPVILNSSPLANYSSNSSHGFGLVPSLFEHRGLLFCGLSYSPNVGEGRGRGLVARANCRPGDLLLKVCLTLKGSRAFETCESSRFNDEWLEIALIVTPHSSNVLTHGLCSGA